MKKMNNNNIDKRIASWPGIFVAFDMAFWIFIQ